MNIEVCFKLSLLQTSLFHVQSSKPGIPFKLPCSMFRVHYPFILRYRSASMAAMQPEPAAVMA